jgi:hypothetical protein
MCPFALGKLIRLCTICDMGTLTRSVAYRCPIHREMVMHAIPEEPAPGDEHRFEAVRCPLCDRIHFVNLANGKEIGEMPDRNG